MQNARNYLFATELQKSAIDQLYDIKRTTKLCDRFVYAVKLENDSFVH